MGDRRFTDGAGRRWDVRVQGRTEWIFEPVDDNPGPRRSTRPPSYEADPFELSVEELQRVLDGAPAPTAKPKQSPFKD